MDECGWVSEVLEEETRKLKSTMLIANETFEKLTALDNQNEYECCTFKNCDFSGGNLSATKFIESEFIDCNLSNAKLNETSILDVQFKSCKMLGIQFDMSNPLLFSAIFENCQLNDCTFYEMKLRQAEFTNSSLEGADFTAADMKEVKITGCDLSNANFDRANLEGADFLMSVRLQIDPELTRITKAKLSMSQLPGLLSKYNLKIKG
ncbi:pentapeptide repeat-containing protein [Ekhidna sp.]